MSFDIFASGSAGTKNNPTIFNYKKDNLFDDDTFDLPVILSKLITMGNMKGAANVVAGAGIPGIVEAAEGLGRMIALDQLNQAMTFLTMRAGARGTIMVTGEEDHLLWAKTSRTVIYTIFSSVQTPGADFITRIGPVLIDTGLDSFGVLLELAKVLSEYQKKIGSGFPGIDLKIKLTKN